MGKTRNAIDSDDCNSNYEDADVETEEADEEEEPSEEDPCEDGPVEENSSEEELDEADPYEEPVEEDPCEEEPSEEGSCEEEPDEDSLCAPNSGNLCEEEPNELLCEEESNEEASCEEECGSEPNEEPCEDPQEEHCESEPSEDPEPNEELCEEDPSEGSCEEEPSESEVPSEDDGETIKSNSEQKSMSANAMPVPKGNAGSLGIDLLGTSRNMSNNVSVSGKVDITRDRSKKRPSRWDIEDGSNGTADVAKEKRKTRWSSDNCQLKETAHLKFPDIAISVEVVKLHAQLLEITQKLQTSYPKLGKKARARRAKLKLQSQKVIAELIQKNPNYAPPPDYNNRPKFSKKIYIPCKEYPEYNFVGLIIGPRGNTQKRMENETGAKIFLRGRGSVQDGKASEKKRHQSSNDDLHVLVEADNQFSFDSAVALVEKLLTPVKDGQNEHKRAQLRELAVLTGTFKGKGPVNSMKMGPCDVCGDASHSTSGCPLTASVPGANINKHEIKFLAELGGEFSSFRTALLPNPYPPSVIDKGFHKSNKESDDAHLFVGHLPQSVDENKLLELFLPFGPLCQARVISDRNTGLSRGYGFVKYTDRVDAAKAVMHMNGYTIDGKVLVVQLAGITPPPVNTNAGSGGFLSSNQLPQYPGYAAIAHNNPDPMCWPGPPGSVLTKPDNLFVKNSNVLPQNPFSGQYSLPSGPSCQPPRPSTLLSADVAESNELAHFPGYLKSFDPPSQLHQPSPLPYMPASQVYFTPDSRHL